MKKYYWKDPATGKYHETKIVKKLSKNKVKIISPITPLWSPMKTKYEHIVVDKSELITEKEYEKVKKDIDLFGKLENLDAWYKW